MHAMVLWALLGGEARAEEVAKPEESPIAEQNAVRRRNGGIALTALGGGILGTGLGMLIAGGTGSTGSYGGSDTTTVTTTTTPTTGTNAGIPVQNQHVNYDYGPPDGGTSDAILVVGGGAVMVLSLPFLASGIPLWISGSERLHDARVAAVPTAGGGQLRFTASF